MLVEPRRVRDRAVELYDEEGALAETLAATWGCPRAGRRGTGRTERCPASTWPSTGCWLAAGARCSRCRRSPRAPTSPAITVRGFEPVAGDAERLAAPGDRARRGGVLGHPVRRRAAPGAERLADVLAEEGVAARRWPTQADPAGRGSGWWWRRSPRASCCPSAALAVLAESDVTGRRAPTGAPRPRARPTDGFFDDLAPGSYVVHRQHGVARYAGVTTRTVGGHHPRLPGARVPGQRPPVPAGRPDRGGHPVQRRASPRRSVEMGGADWQRTRARARAAAGEIAAGAGRALPPPAGRRGPRLRARHAVAARARGGLPLHRDPRPAPGHRRGQGRHGAAAARWTGWSAATSASARPRWRCGPSSRPSRTASRPPSSCRPRCSPASTPRPSSTASPGFPVRVELLQPLPLAGPGRARWSPGWPTARSTW